MFAYAAGEAIGINAASSAFPWLMSNPNKGANPASVSRPSEFRRALQVVHHAAARSSRL
jgi:predicted acyl esterase